MSKDENVLCFERKLLERLGAFQGLILDVDQYFPELTNPANLTYRPRSKVETDVRYKQLIPYVLIICGTRILRYQRGSGGDESRLHGLSSVGVGGHIADEDIDLFSRDTAGYHEGMKREIREEVDVSPTSESVVALINDDSTEVGAVHFGVVHVLRVEDERIVGRRKGIRSPEFVEISLAKANPESYEKWSQLCLQEIDQLLAKAAEVECATSW